MIPNMKRLMTYGLMMLLSVGIGCSGGGGDGSGGGKGDGSGGGKFKRPTVAFVTNGIASFWVVAEAGAKAGADDFNVNVLIKMPADGVGDQKRMLEDLLTQGVDGVAVSPIDPKGQKDILDEVGNNTIYITHDSDAPETNRVCYIGMDNYDAGRMCGKLVKEALPRGGEVMIFVGRIEQLNAKLRRQGLIDELMDRPHNPENYDEPGQPIKGDRYDILDTRTDGFDFSKAKSEAQDAINKYPDLKCMVGLFAYNPPLMLEAVKEAGKTGDIKIVAFDEEDGTLQGIKDGFIFGTVVQDPYQYGYKSVEVLAALARGDKSVVPESKFINIPARQIRADNVDEFWTNLKKLVGGSAGETEVGAGK